MLDGFSFSFLMGLAARLGVVVCCCLKVLLFMHSVGVSAGFKKKKLGLGKIL